jgi:hypothetical protein
MIDGLNETNTIMPTILGYTSHWHKQYSEDSVVTCNADIQTLCNIAKDKTQKGHMLCPQLSEESKKAGRPRAQGR